MTTYFSRPRIQKTLRYAAAYGFFVLFALSGLMITDLSRTNVFDLCLFFKAGENITYFMFSVGSFFLYLPYVLLLAVLEDYLNTAARIDQVLPRAANVAIILGGIGVLTVALYIAFSLIGLPKSI